jgi:hypothetical protein
VKALERRFGAAEIVLRASELKGDACRVDPPFDAENAEPNASAPPNTSPPSGLDERRSDDAGVDARQCRFPAAGGLARST